MSKPFEGILGNSGELKLMEYLLPYDGLEFSIDELSEDILISRKRVIEIVNKFIKWNILKLTRIEEDIKYYSINYDSQIVKSVVQLNNAIIENILGDEMLYEINDYLETIKTSKKKIEEIKA